MLDAAQAQEARLDKAIEACSTEQYKLPYFFRAILKDMLKWEADERLSSIKLKSIFEDPDNQLHDNLDNKDFVDALIENARKQDDNAVLDTFGADAKADQDDDEEDYDSEDSIGFT